MLFRDRFDAGLRLSERLTQYADSRNALIIALPRGGVPVGFEIARGLRVPLDVRLVRKLGAPGQPEFAIGAIAAGVEILNPAAIRGLGLTPEQLESVVERERKELIRREEAFRGERAPIAASGKRVVLVDDGVATGFTMRAAIQVLRSEAASHVTVAVPVGAGSVLRILAQEADDVVCVYAPKHLDAVSRWYEDFEQVSDEEVRMLLAKSSSFSFGQA